MYIRWVIYLKKYINQESEKGGENPWIGVRETGRDIDKGRMYRGKENGEGESQKEHKSGSPSGRDCKMNRSFE